MDMPKKRQNLFTRIELKERIFDVGEHEHKVFMPNETFEQLKGYVNDDGEYVQGFFDVKGNKIKEFTSSTHIAYAYSYVYLAHYMYRYCKYYYYEDFYTEKNIDEKLIKQIMGFPAKADQYTYITKKGGVLEKLGYIRKDSDVPLEPCIVNRDGMDVLENHKQGDLPLEIQLAEAATRGGVFKISHFIMASRYPEIYGNTKNRKINYPVKAFYRDVDLYADINEEEDRLGTFWHIENTHMIDIDVFIYCMADVELGVKAFYLYSFLKYMNDKHPYGFDCSIVKLASLTGLGVKTIRTQLINLEKRNMISNDHKPYCYDKKEWQITKTNTYKALPFSEFILNKLNFNEIPKQRRVSAKTYENEIGFVNYDDDSEDSIVKNEPRTKKTVKSIKAYTQQDNSNLDTYEHKGVIYQLPY